MSEEIKKPKKPKKEKKEKPIILHKALKGCPEKRKDCVGCKHFVDDPKYYLCNSFDWSDKKKVGRKQK